MKFLILLLLLPTLAFASGNGPKTEVVNDSYNTTTKNINNNTTVDESITTEGGAGGNANVTLNIGGASGGGNTRSSTEEDGGTLSPSSDSSSVHTNESNMFALSLGFPNAIGCFGGVEGGGSGGGGVGGFLGFHKLNVACWMNQLAESEKSLPIRVRLKCGDKHFRKAITFDVKGNKREKTQACIDFVAPEWQKEIAAEKAALLGISNQCGTANDVCSYVNGELRHEVTD